MLNGTSLPESVMILGITPLGSANYQFTAVEVWHVGGNRRGGQYSRRLDGLCYAPFDALHLFAYVYSRRGYVVQ